MISRSRLFVVFFLALLFFADHVLAAERFYISIPGPTLSYVLDMNVSRYHGGSI